MFPDFLWRYGRFAPLSYRYRTKWFGFIPKLSYLNIESATFPSNFCHICPCLQTGFHTLTKEHEDTGTLLLPFIEAVRFVLSFPFATRPLETVIDSSTNYKLLGHRAAGVTYDPHHNLIRHSLTSQMPPSLTTRNENVTAIRERLVAHRVRIDEPIAIPKPTRFRLDRHRHRIRKFQNRWKHIKEDLPPQLSRRHSQS